MTATVISLASRRPQPRTRETCGACSRGADGRIRECYPHRLDSLAARLRLDLLDGEGELLVSRERFAGALVDALTVLDGITGECLPSDERNAR